MSERKSAARVAFVRLGRAFPPALPTLARVRLQRPIANREPQKSTAEGRKCGQLFSVERDQTPNLSAIEFAQMRREVTCLEFTTTCSTRCQVWTNESLRAPNEVAAGRERRPHRRQAPRGVRPIQEPSL